MLNFLLLSHLKSSISCYCYRNLYKDRLKVNELHIIDEKGIITSSTIDDYVGLSLIHI